MPELAAPRRGRRAWSAGLAVALLFVLSLPAVTTRIYSSDEVEYFAYLRSLWFDHDVSFENEYQHFYDAGIAQARGFHETFLERTTEAGRRINFATLGCAILWAPFYALGDLVARALSAAGRPVAADGYSWPYIAAVAYGSAAYGALSLVLAMRSARLLGGEHSALDRMSGPAAAAVWLGTPLVFYMYIAPPMSHATSACAVAAFLYAWLIVRERWSVGGFVVLGILAAVMAMVREQDAFFVAAPALDLSVYFVRTTTGANGSGCSRRSRWHRRGTRRLPSAGVRVSGAERTSGSVASRGAQDVMDGAARARCPRVANARVPDVDAAGAAGLVGLAWLPGRRRVRARLAS